MKNYVTNNSYRKQNARKGNKQAREQPKQELD